MPRQSISIRLIISITQSSSDAQLSLPTITMVDAHSHFDGLSSLISFTGFSVPARARFVAQFVGSTLFSSLTMGLVAGQAGAVLLPCGPLIPFMTGSWIGYSWGCIGFWKQIRKKAITCARRYPKVLVHSLLTEFDIDVPTNVRIAESRKEENGTELEDWILAGGLGRLSYGILAAMSCEEDVLEMKKNERQKMVNEYSERD